jgi:hypothetical protein
LKKDETPRPLHKTLVDIGENARVWGFDQSNTNRLMAALAIIVKDLDDRLKNLEARMGD